MPIQKFNKETLSGVKILLARNIAKTICAELNENLAIFFLRFSVSFILYNILQNKINFVNFA